MENQTENLKRKITVIFERTNSRKIYETSAVTLGDFKAELVADGVDVADMDFLEGVSGTELKADRSVLPTNIPYKGKIVNDLVIMMTKSNKKIESGAEIKTREEAYKFIKEHGMENVIKAEFGMPYTNLQTRTLCDVCNGLKTREFPKDKDFDADRGKVILSSEEVKQLSILVFTFLELRAKLTMDGPVSTVIGGVRFTVELDHNDAMEKDEVEGNSGVDEMFKDLR